jgi:uncharacterized protein
MQDLSRILSRAILIAISFYQKIVSPLKPPTCRFHPTCSEYAKEAVEKFGPWKGTGMAVRRLMKCHPFNPGGHDPILKENKWEI